MNWKLKRLRKDYMDTPIPKELDEVVHNTINRKIKKPRRPNPKWIIGLAAAILMFMVSINTSPAFAGSLSKIPVVGSIIQVLTIQEIHVNERHYSADLKIPKVRNFDNKDLENSLNQKYIDESQQLYESFLEKRDQLDEKDGGHLQLQSNYEVVTDNDKILSIKRSIEKTQASSYEVTKYDTIDKQKEIMLTLPILFKNDDYIDTISAVIKNQMRERMEEDPNKIYWVRDAGVKDLPPDGVFDHIDKKQSFYINNDQKLVITFNDYEVAPGYMGTAEFIIPTEKIEKELVGNAYIK
ncbi:anti-sigma-V factor RsiV [Barrientosiimonas marina]|uniref:DUF3298 domain-containing protein n=1 Tax=Lentibacillus kimchii TaxID=1542911 RepID=A0ABW2UXV3_9BACI